MHHCIAIDSEVEGMLIEGFWTRFFVCLGCLAEVCERWLWFMRKRKEHIESFNQNHRFSDMKICIKDFPTMRHQPARSTSQLKWVRTLPVSDHNNAQSGSFFASIYHLLLASMLKHKKAPQSRSQRHTIQGISHVWRTESVTGQETFDTLVDHPLYNYDRSNSTSSLLSAYLLLMQFS